MHTIDNTTETYSKSPSPLRDVTAFTSLTYVLVTLIALILPNANINEACNTLAPGVVIVVLTFTLFHRGTRRELWRSFGLRRAGVRTWGSALGVPTFAVGFTVVASTTPESLAYVAGETGFATLAVVLVMAALLLARAKVWQPPAPTAPRHVTREVVAAAL